MKIKFFSIFLLLAMFATSNAQTLIMTTLKVGEIKLGFPLDSVNKFLDQKISLKPYKQISDTANYSRNDTVYALYKNSKIRLAFSNYFDSYETKKQVIKLESIYTDDINITTKSGIKIGNNKFDIIKKLDGSVLTVMPNAEKGKEYSIVTLMDYTNYNQITFYFKNNILYAMESSSLSDEGGC